MQLGTKLPPSLDKLEPLEREVFTLETVQCLTVLVRNTLFFVSMVILIKT